MVEITGIAQYEAWQQRIMPPAEQVRPSIWSIPVTCDPFAIRYTFAYLVIGEDSSFYLIDPGFQSADGEQQLRDGIVNAGLSLDGLRGVIVTHFHSDHLGAAPRLAREAGVWYGMHEADMLAFPGYPDADEFVARAAQMLDVFGVPQIEDRPGDLTAEHYAAVEPEFLPTRLLRGGEVLELPGKRIELLHTPGHTAGHLSILDHGERVVFSGDHVLPRITSNVSAYPHDMDHDALGDYLESLEALRPWQDYEVLAAHEYRFAGLGDRIDDLIAHHAERGAEIAAVMRQGYETAWEVAQRITWGRGWESLDGMNLRSALGETQAHMNHLRARGTGE